MSEIEITNEQVSIDQKLLEKKPIQLKNLRPLPDPTTNHVPYRGWSGWDNPEYNFIEIMRIMEVESLVMQAFVKKEALMFKEGWELVGKNPATVAYTKKRLAEIANVSKIPTYDLIRSVGAGLIRTSNFFGALLRREKSSSGKERTILTPNGKKKLKPIAAIFPIPVETIEVKRDKHGKLEGIRQSKNLAIGSQSKEFKRDEYLHFKVNDRDGCVVGVPYVIPILDDIRALRRLEQNVEIMTYQYLSPLYKYKIGNEMHPAIATYPDGTDEISMAEYQWSTLPSDGAMIMPWWHDIDVVGAKGHALDPLPILEYYLQRVLVGLGVSHVDVGIGGKSNKSTSDTLSRIIIDSVKYLQRRIEQQFSSYVINPLLLESDFNESTVLSEENAVHLMFKEIDVDTQIKRENHGINMFSGHGITQSEFRHILGREPLSEEEQQDTYFELIQKELALLKTSMSPFGADAPEEPQTNRGQRAAQAVSTPMNQHGRKLGPEARKSSLQPFLKAFAQLRRDITQFNPNAEDQALSELICYTLDDTSSKIHLYLLNSFMSGFDSISSEEAPVFDHSTLTSQVQDRISYIRDFVTTSLPKIKGPTISKLDSYSYLFSQLDDFIVHDAFLYGQLDGFKANNISSVKVRMINDAHETNMSIEDVYTSIDEVFDIEEVNE